MQAAIAVTSAMDGAGRASNYSADVYESDEAGPSQAGSPGNQRQQETANVLADAILSTMAYEEDANYDLGVTDNYVDNHVSF